jgi:hypothetical protein
LESVNLSYLLRYLEKNPITEKKYGLLLQGVLSRPLILQSDISTYFLGLTWSFAVVHA